MNIKLKVLREFLCIYLSSVPIFPKQVFRIASLRIRDSVFASVPEQHLIAITEHLL